MVCAHCGDKLVADGPMGWVHAVGECSLYGNKRCIWGGAAGRVLSCRCGAPIHRSMYGEDGHAVLPITMAAWAARKE